MVVDYPNSHKVVIMNLEVASPPATKFQVTGYPETVFSRTHAKRVTSETVVQCPFASTTHGTCPSRA